MTLDQPVAHLAQQRDRVVHHRILDRRRDAVVELLDRAPVLANVESLARHRVGARHVAASAPVSCCVRATKFGPIRLTMLLVVAVAMISRLRRCSRSRSNTVA
jgi:hypothetical protein